MALPLIGGLLSAVGDIAGSWVKGKMEEKKALTSIKVARAKAVDDILYCSIGRMLFAMDTGYGETGIYIFRRKHTRLVCQLYIHFYFCELWLQSRESRIGHDRCGKKWKQDSDKNG